MSENPQTSHVAERTPSVRGAALRLAGLAAIFGLAYLVLRQTGALSSAAHLVRILRSWRGHGWLPPVFTLAYALLTSLAFPGSIVTLAGGVLFGFALGSTLNWIGATLGACGAYAIARSVAGRSADRLAGKRGADLLNSLRHTNTSFWTLLRLRLVPLVPFNLLNVASGVARVPFKAYLPASALGMLPATLVFTYFADALTSGLAGSRRHALVNLGIAAALLIALSFVPTLAKRLGKRRSS